MKERSNPSPGAHKATLVVIGGATASGKTAVAVELADRLGTEVISADSRQFYKAMQIGTARPLDHELRGIPHHFLGHLELHENWSAGAFARAAEPVLQQIIASRGTAIMVGGSGLYIDALLKGFDPLPATDIRLREKLLARLKDHGISTLLEELHTLDPITWESIDRRNPHRVIRSLEICLITGRPVSAQRTSPADRDDLRIVRIALDLPRKELYDRIDRRVDQMVKNGWLDEARGLRAFRQLNALRTVGYRELFEHFDGTIGLFETIDLIKQHTRNYAKRQLTWFRRDGNWIALPAAELGRMLDIVRSPDR